MPKVTFVEHTGKEHVLEAKVGLSLMEVAVENNVPGIDADCGGACACATCHVYVDEAWRSKLNPAEDTEQAMVECADGFEEGASRLSCQVPITDALDGLIVTVPD